MIKNIRNSRSFTLLELVLAISVSSIIITGMMQSVRNVQQILSRSRNLLHANKAACLFFNQIERDLNTAFIPESKVSSEENTQNKNKKKPTKKASQNKKKGSSSTGASSSKEVIFFIADADEEDQIKSPLSGTKKYRPFKKLSFVCTNPLQIWGQSRERIVRVGYELIENKEASKERKEPSYDLYRKETTDIENSEFNLEKASPSTRENPKKKQLPIRKHLVAENIKSMSIEYHMPYTEEKKLRRRLSDSEEVETKLFESFSWGIEEKSEKTPSSKNVVPQRATIRISFWEEATNGEKTYFCSIPILSFPTTIKKKQKPKKPKEPTKKDQKKNQKEKKR